MAGIVVSKNGVGGVTINIPLQFDVLTHNTRVITDGFTASAVADALQIPDQLKTLMQETEKQATSLLGNVLPIVSTPYDVGTNTFVEDAGTLPMDAIGSATKILIGSDRFIGHPGESGKMEGFIKQRTTDADGTMTASMKKLSALGGAETFADFKSAAASAATFPDTSLVTPQQSAQQLSKFNDLSGDMKDTNSELGGAVSQITDITKNAPMLSSMGTLAGGIAKASGLPAPPSMDDAFAELADGTVGNSLNTLNSGMSIVSGVADLPAYSGQLDDIDDLVWNKSFMGEHVAMAIHGSITTMDTFSSPDALRTAGTYTNVTVVGTFDIVIDEIGAITSVIVITGGTGHAIGDTITIADFDLGGSVPAGTHIRGSGGADDFTMNVATINSSSSLRTAGTYTNVTGSSNGTGTVGTFTITVDVSGAVSTVVVVTPGVGHSVDDIITIADADLGGGGATDFTMEVATLSGMYLPNADAAGHFGPDGIIPSPAWVNPNKFNEKIKGEFPTGVPMGEALDTTKYQMLSTVESVKSKIDKALGPITTMGNATALATGLQTRSPAFDAEFRGGLKDASEAMYDALFPKDPTGYYDPAGDAGFQAAPTPSLVEMAHAEWDAMTPTEQKAARDKAEKARLAAEEDH